MILEKLFYELISDKKVKRSLKIISILSNAKHEISLKSLEGMLEVTKKTLAVDLSEIQPILPKDYQLHISEKNISLRSKTNDSVEKVLIEIAKSTLTYKLLDSIFCNRYANIHDYSEHLYISVTSLKRKIIYINRVLEMFGCKISPYSMKMTGSEVNIRYFFYTFFSELQEEYVINDDARTEDNYEIYVRMKNNINRFNQQINFGYRQGTMWLFVTRIRIGASEYVKLPQSFITRIQSTEDFKNFKESYEDEIQNYTNLEFISDDEMIWAYIVILDAIVYSYHDRSPALYRSDSDNLKTLQEIDPILEPMIQRLKIPKAQADKFMYIHRAYLLNLSLLNELSPIFQKTSQSIKYYIQDSLETIYDVWYKYLKNIDCEKFCSESFLEDVCVKLAMISSQFFYHQEFKIKKILFAFSGEAGFVAYLETMALNLLPKGVEAIFNSSTRITESLVRELEPDLIVCNFKNLGVINNCAMYRISHIPTIKEWTVLREHILSFEFRIDN